VGLWHNALTNCVNGGLTIFRRAGILLAATSLVLLAGAALSRSVLPTGVAITPDAAPAIPIIAPPVPQMPTIAQALQSGVLIVVSKASQRMEVFKDGTPWLDTAVSTGRRGHGTPAGVFPILEKQRFHRSNIYSNAPMPFMQRLTYGGIAIHAGHLPGYPASHGCIRVAYDVARSLFGLTRVRATTVVVLNEAVQSDEQARILALAVQPQDHAAPIRLAQAPVQISPPPRIIPVAMPEVQPATGTAQTIQLVAALSSQDAEARWNGLINQHAELARFDKTVVPVVVASRRYFRLRASGPGAFATCSRLKSAGVDCFKVLS